MIDFLKYGTLIVCYFVSLAILSLVMLFFVSYLLIYTWTMIFVR